MKRHHNHGLRKLCSCPRRKWSTCPHSYYFSFQWRGVHHRFSLDHHLGRHIIGKTAAQTEADKIRAAIRRAEFTPYQTDETQVTRKVVTLDTFAALYLDRALKGRRDDRSQLKRLCEFVLPDTGERLGAKVLKDIVEDDLEVFAESLRAQNLAGSTRNHYVQLLKAMFRWAAKKGYIDRTPISEDSALKREKTNGRARRLMGTRSTGYWRPHRHDISDSSSGRWRPVADKESCLACSGRTSIWRGTRSPSAPRTRRTKKTGTSPSLPDSGRSWKWVGTTRQARSSAQSTTCSETRSAGS